MYKGHKIREIVTRDYQYPQTEIVVDAPAGCAQCEHEQKVQSGHFLCSLTPDDLINDDNVIPVLDDVLGWILVWNGANGFVGEWVD